MKKRRPIQVVALLLAFMMCVGSFQMAGAVNAPADTVRPTPFEDNFNDGISNWETIFFDSKAEGFSDARVGTDGTNQYLIPAISGLLNSGVKNSVTTVKDSVFEGGRAEVVSFDFDFAGINYYNNASFLMYCEPATGKYVELNFLPVQVDDAIALHLRVLGEGISVSPSGSGAWMKLEAGPAGFYNAKIEYDYTEWANGKFTVYVTVENSASETVVDKKAFACSVGTGALDENFKIGFSATNTKTDVVYFDNFYALTYGMYAKAEAERFRAEYNGILSKEIAAVTVQDLAEIQAALNALQLVRIETLERLKDDRAKLNAMYDFLISEIPEFAEDDFNDYTLSAKLWKTTLLGSGSLTSDYELKNIDGRNVLQPAFGKNRAITTVDDQFWGTGNPLSAEFRLNVKNITNYNTSPDIVPYFDAATNSYLALRFMGSSDATSFKLGVYTANGMSFFPNAGAGMIYNNNDFIPSADGVVVVKISYNYQNWSDGLLYITVSVSNSEKEIFSKTYRCTLNTSHSEYFKIGVLNNNDSGTAYYDYIAAKGRFITDQAYIDTFNNKYAAVKEMDIHTITPQEDALLCEALDYYMRMRDSARVQLAMESTFNKLVLKTEELIRFENTHRYALALDERTVTPDDKDDINNMLLAFENLSPKEQYFVFEKAFKARGLLEILDPYVPAVSVGDFSAFTENFESGLTKWETSITSPENSTDHFEIIADPDNAGNKVLRAQSLNSFLLPLERYWPENGQMTHISYKIRPQENTANYMNTSFVSPSDYDLLLWFELQNPTVIIMGYRSGEYYNNGGWQRPDFHLSDSWYTVDIAFSTNTYSMVVTDDEGNIYTRLNIPRLSTKDIFAIGYAASVYIGDVIPCVLYDDIQIDFTRAFWETDQQTETTEVYFDGNTYVGPGETVTLSGENLYDTVKKAEIYQLPNDKAGDIGYIAEQYYNKLEKAGGCEASWDAAKAKPLEIVQWTDTSMKFIIPEEYTDGVYAVKLYSNHVLTAEEIAQGISYDKIVYINNPNINFTIADEGEVATPSGWITVVGSNLVPSYLKNDVSAVLRDKNGNFIALDVIEINKNDAYYVKVAIPENLEAGDGYDILLHNGYGDHTAWSQPYAVKIGASPKESWAKKVYDITDYGAKPDGVTDATAAFITAFEAANKETNGGVILVPEGIYSVSNTLVIPENIVLKGESKYRSIILFNAKYWEYGKTPPSLLSFTSNVEICDIGFHGTRHSTVVVAESTPKNENVYLHDLVFQFTEYLGPPSAGVGSTTGKLTSVEMAAEITRELARERYAFRIHGGMLRNTNKTTENFQFINVDWTTDAPYYEENRSLHAKLAYSIISNCEFNRFGWTNINAQQSVLLEDNVFDTDSCIGVLGNYYMGDTVLMDQLGNNREIFTQDGSLDPTPRAIKFLGDNPSVVGNSPDEVTYGFIQGSVVNGGIVYACAGQGNGQMRYVTSTRKMFVQDINSSGHLLFTDAENQYIYKDSSGAYKYEATDALFAGDIATLTKCGNEMLVFTVNEPFAVQPNINTKIITGERRDGMFTVNCTFDNGQGSGCYGTLVDAVYDHCTFKQHLGQQFNLHGGLLWYVSNINGVTEDPFTYFWNGAEHLTAHNYMFDKSTAPNNALCILYKNNLLKEGSALKMSGLGKDFVIEGNTFEDGDCAITVTQTNITGDGCLLYNNHFGAYYPYSNGFRSVLNKDVNEQQSFLYYCLDTLHPIDGDVNMDGKLSLKDITLINYYLLGKVEFSAEQLEQGDYNADGVVNTKDARAMREVLLQMQ